MRVRFNAMIGLALVVGLVAGGCWANFPDSRFTDGTTGQTDWISPPSDIGDIGPQPDGQLPPDAGADRGAVTCKPNTFIACITGGKALQRCNAQGDAILTVDCKGATCDPKKKRCCADNDGDSFSCDDCNDNNKDVFPGQQKFFAGDADGSFDYNCDKKSELELSTPIACVGAGKCSGSGWVGGVPACGKEGQFATCIKFQGKCQPGLRKKRKQRCR